jgi:hypothetical protein
VITNSATQNWSGVQAMRLSRTIDNPSRRQPLYSARIRDHRLSGHSTEKRSPGYCSDLGPSLYAYPDLAQMDTPWGLSCDSNA